MPKQPVKSAARFDKSGGFDLFMLVGLFLFIVAVVGSGATFGFELYLKSVADARAVQLANAEASINADNVEQFIRSRDRFIVAKGILDGHVATSNFFDVLESVTLQSVRFSSFAFELRPDGSAEIRLGGNARSFNALAAQSSVLTEEKRIKRAIFSDIKVSENGTVTFQLSAELDSRLLSFTPGTAPPVQAATTTVQQATSTATTTTP